ncbi:copper homeostasis protein CutC [Paracoccus albus]|uniref:copper homeostasis protein CutC n=1 Tax=Paracoccus albus TaxID=3017784 RepID=UPI0022F070BE|nr:copper homeostasis protein CutC [Paracoccus albus]WBU59880.1 copper homeostasis protein CutC [Paracoccus albus]
MNRITLEICVDDEAGIRAAADGGADRIELCAALGVGGLTPSAGLMLLARRSSLPSMVMIRPRAGDFVWNRAERDAMLAEIAAVKAAGLAGVVIGASLPDGRLDTEAMTEMVRAAEGLDITLHRAIDLVPDPAESMRLVEGLGVRRVLSSGGATTALSGIDRLKLMSDTAPSVTVMPGGGVSALNAATFADAIPLREIHASASVMAEAPSLRAIAEFGFQPAGSKRTDRDSVRALRDALDLIAGQATDR